MAHEADAEDGLMGRFRVAGFGGAAWFMRAHQHCGGAQAESATRKT